MGTDPKDNKRKGDKMSEERARMSDSGRLAVLLAASVALSLGAETLTLTSSGDAATAANWDKGRLPAVGDTALVGSGRALTITSDLTADALWTDAGGNVRGTVTQSAGTVALGGTGTGDTTAPLRLGNDGGAVGSYRLMGGNLNVPNGLVAVGCWGFGSILLSGENASATFGFGYPSLGRWNNGSTVGEGSLVVEDGATVSFTGTDGFVCVGERGRGSLAVRDGASVMSAKPFRLGVYSDSSGSEGRLVVGADSRVETPSVGVGAGRTGIVTVIGGTLAPRPRQSVASAFLGAADGSVRAAVSVGGATVDVADGDFVTCRAPLGATRLTAANLAHRWRFNGTLEDEVGGQAATRAGSNQAGIVLDAREVSLPGGSHGSAYVKLGKGAIPTSADGVTIELWATPRAFTKNWDRIFSANLDWNDAWSQNLLSPCWSTSNSLGDYVMMHWNSWTDQYVYDVFAVSGAEYVLGQEEHLAIVVKPVEGAWHAVFYRHDPRSGRLLRTKDITVNNADWTPAYFAEMVLNIGYSFDKGNPDACASYNEFRTWKIALTEEELRTSALLGPDADLGASGFVKAGAGTLALAAGNAYAGATTVADGTLSLVPLVTPLNSWRVADGAVASDIGDTALQVCGANKGQIILADGYLTLPGVAHETAYLQVDSVFAKFDEATGATLEFRAKLGTATPNWERLLTLFTDGVATGLQMTWGADSRAWDQCAVRNNWEETKKTSVLCDGTQPWQVGEETHVALVLKKTSAGFDVTLSRRVVGTGVCVKSATVATTWTTAQVKALTLRLGWAWDTTKDACGSFGAVRVWPTALSDDDLTRIARGARDVLPIVAASVPTEDVLPSGTDLSLAEDAVLALGGMTQKVASLSGTGTVSGPGRLSVTGRIAPGGAEAVGTLTLAEGATLSGTVELNVRVDGTCDRLAFAAGATYDLSELTLQFSASSDVPGTTRLCIGEVPTGATVTGTPNLSALPDGYRIRFRSNGMWLCPPRGAVLLIR